MSKKKKKTRASIADQKLWQAQGMNDFMHKLKHICDIVAGEGAFNVIPPEYKMLIYRYRGVPVKITHSDDQRIQQQDLKIIKRFINMSVAQCTIKLRDDDEREISLYDFFYVADPLMAVACKKKYYPFEGQEIFEEIGKRRGHLNRLYKLMLEKSAILVCEYLSDCRKGWVYTCRTDTEMDDWFDLEHYDGLSQRSMALRMLQKSDFRMHQIVNIGIHEIETHAFRFHNETHSGIKLEAWLFDTDTFKNEILPVEMPLDKIVPDTRFGKLKVPVYIQIHAINRLMERLGAKIPAQAIGPLSEIIDNFEIIPLGNKKFLIPYCLDGLKCGYLLADFIDACIFIRTFLFLTNNGTPEGKKLEEQTRLMKEDKQYLQIDNLSGLLQSDLLTDKMTQSIFENAGCESLIELCRRIKENQARSQPEEKKKKQASPTKLSDLLARYLSSEHTKMMSWQPPEESETAL